MIAYATASRLPLIYMLSDLRTGGIALFFDEAHHIDFLVFCSTATFFLFINDALADPSLAALFEVTGDW